jgi:hypothetical protein
MRLFGKRDGEKAQKYAIPPLNVKIHVLRKIKRIPASELLKRGFSLS